MECPACSSEDTIKNGSVRGRSRGLCKACGRSFIIDPHPRRVSDEKRALVDRLLLERVSLRGIARAVEVSLSWVQMYVNAKLEEQPRQIEVSSKKKGA